jgi:hypothetical protein
MHTNSDEVRNTNIKDVLDIGTIGCMACVLACMCALHQEQCYGSTAGRWC